MWSTRWEAAGRRKVETKFKLILERMSGSGGNPKNVRTEFSSTAYGGDGAGRIKQSVAVGKHIQLVVLTRLIAPINITI